MGIYVYTLRKKTIPVTLASGETVGANLFSYAYRYCGDYEDIRDAYRLSTEEKKYARSYRMRASNASRLADAAFAAPRSGIFVMGDEEKLDGCAVYDGLTKPVWYDCNKKVWGNTLGFLKRSGKRWLLSQTSEWREVSVGTKDGWVKRLERDTVRDGEIHKEIEGLGSTPYLA